MDINANVDNGTEAEVLFPWEKHVRKKLLKSFPNVKTKVINSLSKNICEEFEKINWDNKKRIVSFYETLKHFYLHFCGKIKGEEESYLETSCILILYYMSSIALRLSNGKIASKWLNQILLILKTYPGSFYKICDVLLLIKNVKRKYHLVYAEILKFILQDKKLKNPVDAESFVKIMLLVRRFKALSSNGLEKRHISSLASTIKCPPNTSNWITAFKIDSLCDITQENIAEKLIEKKLQSDVIQQLFLALFENKYDEKILNVPRLSSKDEASTSSTARKSDVKTKSEKGFKNKQNRRQIKKNLHGKPKVKVKSKMCLRKLGVVKDKTSKNKQAPSISQTASISEICEEDMLSVSKDTCPSSENVSLSHNLSSNTFGNDITENISLFLTISFSNNTQILAEAVTIDRNKESPSKLTVLKNKKKTLLETSDVESPLSEIVSEDNEQTFEQSDKSLFEVQVTKNMESISKSMKAKRKISIDKSCLIQSNESSSKLKVLKESLLGISDIQIPSSETISENSELNFRESNNNLLEMQVNENVELTLKLKKAKRKLSTDQSCLIQSNESPSKPKKLKNMPESFLENSSSEIVNADNLLPFSHNNKNLQEIQITEIESKEGNRDFIVHQSYLDKSRNTFTEDPPSVPNHKDLHVSIEDSSRSFCMDDISLQSLRVNTNEINELSGAPTFKQKKTKRKQTTLYKYFSVDSNAKKSCLISPNNKRRKTENESKLNESSQKFLQGHDDQHATMCKESGPELNLSVEKTSALTDTEKDNHEENQTLILDRNIFPQNLPGSFQSDQPLINKGNIDEIHGRNENSGLINQKEDNSKKSQSQQNTSESINFSEKFNAKDTLHFGEKNNALNGEKHDSGESLAGLPDCTSSTQQLPDSFEPNKIFHFQYKSDTDQNSVDSTASSKQHHPVEIYNEAGSKDCNHSNNTKSYDFVQKNRFSVFHPRMSYADNLHASDIPMNNAYCESNDYDFPAVYKGIPKDFKYEANSTFHSANESLFENKDTEKETIKDGDQPLPTQASINSLNLAQKETNPSKFEVSDYISVSVFQPNVVANSEVMSQNRDLNVIPQSPCSQKSLHNHNSIHSSPERVALSNRSHTSVAFAGVNILEKSKSICTSSEDLDKNLSDKSISPKVLSQNKDLNVVPQSPCSAKALVNPKSIHSSPESLDLTNRSHISAASVKVNILEKSKSIYTSSEDSDKNLSDKSISPNIRTSRRRASKIKSFPKHFFPSSDSELDALDPPVKFQKRRRTNRRASSKKFISDLSSDTDDEKNVSKHASSAASNNSHKSKTNFATSIKSDIEENTSNKMLKNEASQLNVRRKRSFNKNVSNEHKEENKSLSVEIQLKPIPCPLSSDSNSPFENPLISKEGSNKTQKTIEKNLDSENALSRETFSENKEVPIRWKQYKSKEIISDSDSSSDQSLPESSVPKTINFNSEGNSQKQEPIKKNLDSESALPGEPFSKNDGEISVKKKTHKSVEITSTSDTSYEQSLKENSDAASTLSEESFSENVERNSVIKKQLKSKEITSDSDSPCKQSLPKSSTPKALNCKDEDSNKTQEPMEEKLDLENDKETPVRWKQYKSREIISDSNSSSEQSLPNSSSPKSVNFNDEGGNEMQEPIKKNLDFESALSGKPILKNYEETSVRKKQHKSKGMSSNSGSSFEQSLNKNSDAASALSGKSFSENDEEISVRKKQHKSKEISSNSDSSFEQSLKRNFDATSAMSAEGFSVNDEKISVRKEGYKSKEIISTSNSYEQSPAKSNALKSFDFNDEGNDEKQKPIKENSEEASEKALSEATFSEKDEKISVRKKQYKSKKMTFDSDSSYDQSLPKSNALKTLNYTDDEINKESANSAKDIQVELQEFEGHQNSGKTISGSDDDSSRKQKIQKKNTEEITTSQNQEASESDPKLCKRVQILLEDYYNGQNFNLPQRKTKKVKKSKKTISESDCESLVEKMQNTSISLSNSNHEEVAEPLTKQFQLFQDCSADANLLTNSLFESLRSEKYIKKCNSSSDKTFHSPSTPSSEKSCANSLPSTVTQSPSREQESELSFKSNSKPKQNSNCIKTATRFSTRLKAKTSKFDEEHVKLSSGVFNSGQNDHSRNVSNSSFENKGFESDSTIKNDSESGRIHDDSSHNADPESFLDRSAECSELDSKSEYSENESENDSFIDDHESYESDGLNTSNENQSVNCKYSGYNSGFSSRNSSPIIKSKSYSKVRNKKYLSDSDDSDSQNVLNNSHSNVVKNSSPISSRNSSPESKQKSNSRRKSKKYLLGSDSSENEDNNSSNVVKNSSPISSRNSSPESKRKSNSRRKSKKYLLDSDSSENEDNNSSNVVKNSSPISSRNSSPESKRKTDSRRKSKKYLLGSDSSENEDNNSSNVVKNSSPISSRNSSPESKGKSNSRMRSKKYLLSSDSSKNEDNNSSNVVKNSSPISSRNSSPESKRKSNSRRKSKKYLLGSDSSENEDNNSSNVVKNSSPISSRNFSPESKRKSNSRRKSKKYLLGSDSSENEDNNSSNVVKNSSPTSSRNSSPESKGKSNSRMRSKKYLLSSDSSKNDDNNSSNVVKNSSPISSRNSSPESKRKSNSRRKSKKYLLGSDSSENENDLRGSCSNISSNLSINSSPKLKSNSNKKKVKLSVQECDSDEVNDQNSFNCKSKQCSTNVESDDNSPQNSLKKHEVLNNEKNCNEGSFSSFKSSSDELKDPSSQMTIDDFYSEESCKQAIPNNSKNCSNLLNLLEKIDSNSKFYKNSVVESHSDDQVISENLGEALNCKSVSVNDSACSKNSPSILKGWSSTKRMSKSSAAENILLKCDAKESCKQLTYKQEMLNNGDSLKENTSSALSNLCLSDLQQPSSYIENPNSLMCFSQRTTSAVDQDREINLKCFESFSFSESCSSPEMSSQSLKMSKERNDRSTCLVPNSVNDTRKQSHCHPIVNRYFSESDSSMSNDDIAENINTKMSSKGSNSSKDSLRIHADTPKVKSLKRKRFCRNSKNKNYLKASNSKNGLKKEKLASKKVCKKTSPVPSSDSSEDLPLSKIGKKLKPNVTPTEDVSDVKSNHLSRRSSRIISLSQSTCSPEDLQLWEISKKTNLPLSPDSAISSLSNKSLKDGDCIQKNAVAIASLRDDSQLANLIKVEHRVNSTGQNTKNSYKSSNIRQSLSKCIEEFESCSMTGVPEIENHLSEDRVLENNAGHLTFSKQSLSSSLENFSSAKDPTAKKLNSNVEICDQLVKHYSNVKNSLDSQLENDVLRFSPPVQAQTSSQDIFSSVKEFNESQTAMGLKNNASKITPSTSEKDNASQNYFVSKDDEMLFQTVIDKLRNDPNSFPSEEYLNNSFIDNILDSADDTNLIKPTFISESSKPLFFNGLPASSLSSITNVTNTQQVHNNCSSTTTKCNSEVNMAAELCQNEFALNSCAEICHFANISEEESCKKMSLEPADNQKLCDLDNQCEKNAKVLFICDVEKKSCKVHLMPDAFLNDILDRSADITRSSRLSAMANKCKCVTCYSSSKCRSDESNKSISRPNYHNKINGNISGGHFYINGIQVSTASIFPVVNLGRRCDEDVLNTDCAGEKELIGRSSGRRVNGNPIKLTKKKILNSRSSTKSKISSKQSPSQLRENADTEDESARSIECPRKKPRYNLRQQRKRL